MKKVKFISFKYLIVCLIFIYGCDDNNPIKQIEGPYQFDSARFEYKVTRLQGIWYDTGELWAQDTNQVFIVNLSIRDLFIFLTGRLFTTMIQTLVLLQLLV